MSAMEMVWFSVTATLLLPLFQVRLPAAGKLVILTLCRLLPVSMSLKEKSLASRV